MAVQMVSFARGEDRRWKAWGLALLIALILWTIAMVLFEAIVSRISN